MNKHTSLEEKPVFPLPPVSGETSSSGGSSVGGSDESSPQEVQLCVGLEQKQQVCSLKIW